MNDFKKKIGQDPVEFVQLLDIMADYRITSYLEVGARYGGTFFAVVSRLPKSGTYVAVDLPGAKFGAANSEQYLQCCIRELKAAGYADVHLFLGDSTDEHVIAQVQQFGRFDLVLIDGDHTYYGVLSDFFYYGHIADIVALHDIDGKGQTDHMGNPVEVYQLWEQIRGNAKSREIINPQNRGKGLGVIWH
jgi:cephalosporin hydroxylase